MLCIFFVTIVFSLLMSLEKKTEWFLFHGHPLPLYHSLEKRVGTDLCKGYALEKCLLEPVC